MHPEISVYVNFALAIWQKPDKGTSIELLSLTNMEFLHAKIFMVDLSASSSSLILFFFVKQTKVPVKI